jgi:WD40 repeat protein
VAIPLTGHTNFVTSVALSLDGTRIISGSWDRTVRVWDAQNKGRAFGLLEGHTDSVYSVAVSPDGTCIISGSADFAIRIWDMFIKDSDDNNLLDWELRDDGWATTRDERRLLWVPADLRTGLLRPRNRAVIYRYGSLRLNFDSVMMGERWRECYINR